MDLYNNFSFTSYVVDENIWKFLKSDLENYSNILIITGDLSLASIEANLKNLLINKKYKIEKYMGECSHENISSILAKTEDEKFDLVLGVGGGKAIDSSKIIAAKLGLDIFIIPTIASTCAATSSLSVVYSNHGVFEEIYYLDKPPLKVFIDLKTIFDSPSKFTWAGIGDTLAKFYEVRIKKDDMIKNSKSINFPSSMGISLSENCRNIILKDGESALYGSEITEEFKNVILTIIVNTGMVSNLVDEFLNGAIAHSVFYGLTLLPRTEKEHLHGEVVAYGILVQLYLENKMDEYKELKEFFEICKFPTKLEDVAVLDEFNEKKEEILTEILNGPDFIDFTFEVKKEDLMTALEY